MRRLNEFRECISSTIECYTSYYQALLACPSLPRDIARGKGSAGGGEEGNNIQGKTIGKRYYWRFSVGKRAIDASVPRFGICILFRLLFV